MTDSTGAVAPLSLEEKKFFFDRAKFLRDHIQAVLGVATGALVVSVTFLHDRASSVQRVDLLKTCWMLLSASILVGLAYNYVIFIHAKQYGSRYGALLNALSALFHVAFVLSMLYLMRFGMSNL